MSEFKSLYRAGPTPISKKGSLISTSPEQSSHVTRRVSPHIAEDSTYDAFS
jgi:hypothetical protein